MFLSLPLRWTTGEFGLLVGGGNCGPSAQSLGKGVPDRGKTGSGNPPPGIALCFSGRAAEAGRAADHLRVGTGASAAHVQCQMDCLTTLES